MASLKFRALIRLKRDEPNNSTIRENISYVFGPKQLSTLLEIVMTEPSQDILEEFKIDNQYENIFRL
ncbi:hypothetical protein V9T40_013090 [Parthenolecanium corni]|uniref:Uncharacterized protein n=1 Tax=Parthenolecanium corni TaxID=536013 RepID=A0AAN9TN30_9HEMI